MKYCDVIEILYLITSSRFTILKKQRGNWNNNSSIGSSSSGGGRIKHTSSKTFWNSDYILASAIQSVQGTIPLEDCFPWSELYSYLQTCIM